MTISPPAVRLGAQQPRVSSAPPAVSSAGQEAIDLAAAAGLVLDPWQRYVLDRALGEKADGRWSAFEVGLIVPRQNGKGSVLEARELFGLFLAGERLILHSAHEHKTAKEAFLRIKALIQETPELDRQVANYYQSNENTSIDLRNGARLRFVARSGGSARGFSADCVILDEAYNLPDEALAAMLPTMAARPNPQLWYTSSAGTDSSEVLARVRKRGTDGDARLAFFEWSAEKDSDPDDPMAWALANPGLGIRLDEDFILSERGALGPVEFARERLGIWDEAMARALVVDPAVWEALTGRSVPPDDEPPACLAVDRWLNGATSIAAAWRTPTGVHVELVAVDVTPDDSRVVQWITERAGKRIPVLIASDSTAAALVPDLRQARVRVDLVGATDYARACVGFVDDIGREQLSHAGQVQVSAAMTGAKKRNIGVAGAWGWDRKSPSNDISPLVAVTLARLGAVSSKPKTTRPGGRKAVVL